VLFIPFYLCVLLEMSLWAQNTSFVALDLVKMGEITIMTFNTLVDDLWIGWTRYRVLLGDVLSIQYPVNDHAKFEGWVLYARRSIG